MFKIWCNHVFLPFFGRPLPLPSRDFLSSSLLLGLVGVPEDPLTTSPLSLRESPLPESLEEFFLSFRLAFALRRASWMLLLEVDNQLPLISLMFLLDTADPLLSSSPDTNESLRSSASVGVKENIKNSFYMQNSSERPRLIQILTIVLFIFIYICITT